MVNDGVNDAVNVMVIHINGSRVENSADLSCEFLASSAHFMSFSACALVSRS